MSKIVSGSDYLSLPSAPATWLVDPLLPTGGALLMYGEAKLGKSYAALQLADAIHNGDHWLGFQTRAGKVVYIQLDTPRTVWQDRLRDIRKTGPLLDFFQTDRELLEAWPFDILNPDHYIMLRAELQALNPDLVIFDTLRESHSADENDSTQMQKVVAALTAVSQPAAMCFISHARKPIQDQDLSLMSDNRGSSYVVGRMDAIVRFTKKSCRVGGRSIEEHSIELERMNNGFWEVANQAEIDMHCLSVLLAGEHADLKAAAKAMSNRLNKPEEACRGMLRRYLASHGDVSTHLR